MNNRDKEAEVLARLAAQIMDEDRFLFVAFIDRCIDLVHQS